MTTTRSLMCLIVVLPNNISPSSQPLRPQTRQAPLSFESTPPQNLFQTNNCEFEFFRKSRKVSEKVSIGSSQQHCFENDGKVEKSQSLSLSLLFGHRKNLFFCSVRFSVVKCNRFTDHHRHRRRRRRRRRRCPPTSKTEKPKTQNPKVSPFRRTFNWFFFH